ncbi:MAG: aldehyde ferredoxin oxidoreductase family protein [Dehalococcoidia bacterium]|nr:MAG: aldehyde ferredoxin oxidoreductase family protein [Dehalococcoidia bacterium]
MAGFEGRILEINLTTGEIGQSTIDKDVLRKFIGGSGLAAKLFLDRVSPDVDPLSADNILFIMTGPVTGTTLPGAARFSAGFKSPLTNIWGEANCGGHFGPELRYAGYDGIAIEGASAKPVYILIDDGKVEIKDASDLWGKDNYQTSDLLKEREGGKRKVKVLSIGQAGENLVKYASIQNDKEATLGRCGGGAVMGSKKLKAIAVRGTGKVEAADAAAFGNSRKDLITKVNEHIATIFMRDHGTNGGLMVCASRGDMPAKNWTLGDSMAVGSQIEGMTMSAKYLVRSNNCHNCTIGCKRVVAVKEGPYLTEEGPGPEYESTASLGSLCMVDDLAGLIKANEKCNKYGLDVISCGSAIAFAIECFENGLIGSEATGGIVLKWGDIDAVMKTIDKIAQRDGFGDILAEGVKRAAEKIGKNAGEYAMEVKGLEVPMHDPRAGHGMGLTYATSIRGACHLMSHDASTEIGAFTSPEIGLTGGYDPLTSQGKAEMTMICENVSMVFNAADICNFAMLALGMEDLLNILRMTTGFDYDLKEMMECGERIWMLKRGLGNLMGAGVADDRLPQRILTPTADGPAAGSAPDLKLMLKEYYQLRPLDAQGRPDREKLRSLGLSELAAKLG